MARMTIAQLRERDVEYLAHFVNGEWNETEPTEEKTEISIIWVSITRTKPFPVSAECGTVKKTLLKSRKATGGNSLTSSKTWALPKSNTFERKREK